MSQDASASDQLVSAGFIRVGVVSQANKETNSLKDAEVMGWDEMKLLQVASYSIFSRGGADKAGDRRYPILADRRMKSV